LTDIKRSHREVVAAHGKATIHSLRHTFASWLLQNGADLAEVQDTLGHTSMNMTR
jgi:site-specific recombinase XerD